MKSVKNDLYLFIRQYANSQYIFSMNNFSDTDYTLSYYIDFTNHMYDTKVDFIYNSISTSLTYIILTSISNKE